MLTAGTQITKEMVEMVSIPEGIINDNIVSVSSVIGKYAEINLYAGDYLTTAKLSYTLEKINAFSAGINKEKLVISITLQSLASGVSGRLLPGDIVTIPSGAGSRCNPITEIKAERHIG